MFNAGMDKYEFRRLAFRQLVDSSGGLANIARVTGISDNYLSRMLYPDGKANRKRIGEGMVDRLNKFYPAWLEVDVSDVTANPFVSKRKTEREQRIRDILALCRETQDTGIDLILDYAKMMHAKFPIPQQTTSSQ